jgi:hypothetical protein
MKINVNDFSYQNKIYSKSKNFGILKLSDQGFNEYIDKDSYTHTYLYTKHLNKLSNFLNSNEKEPKIVKQVTKDNNKSSNFCNLEKKIEE